MSRWKAYFNRGAKDCSQAWVIENLDEPSTKQIVAAKLKLNGAIAESQFAPDECPKGFFIISGKLKFQDQVAEFLQ